VKGALLATRFASLEELKSAIQIEYHGDATNPDGTIPDNCFVVLRHCSNGKAVTHVLKTGISQNDLHKVAFSHSLWDRLLLLYRCPFAVANRKDLEVFYNLSRWEPVWFGEGDAAFWDIAKSTAEHINTPDLAFRNPRDSTEKGYINSFNHLTAQAFITSCFSEEMADFIGDAHERKDHPELITGKFTEAQINDLAEGPVDNYVDLINNEWGQEIGKQLREKYGIDRETVWTPELLADYLNDLQSYYSWAFQIGFKPFRPEDKVVSRFAFKVNALKQGHYSFYK
jgi:hypothetical protein